MHHFQNPRESCEKLTVAFWPWLLKAPRTIPEAEEFLIL